MIEFMEYLYERKHYNWNPFSTLSLDKDDKIKSWRDIDDFLSDIPHYRWYCGVEVHKKSLVWALYGISAEENIQGPVLQCKNNLMIILQFREVLKIFNPIRFLMETTGIFHFNVAWELMDAFPEADVAVMNAKLIHRYVSGVRKNDRSDARKLAVIARYDELIRYSYVPSKSKAILRELTRMREQYVKEATKIKNRIKKIFAEYGFNWDFSFEFKGGINFILGFLQYDKPLHEFIALCQSAGAFPHMKKYFDELLQFGAFSPSSEVRKSLIFCFHSLGVHQIEVRLVEKQIYDTVETLPEIQTWLWCLEEIPGMQKMTKIAFLAEIGNINRFPSAGDMLVYAGIAPRGGSSGLEEEDDTKEKVVKRDRPNQQCNKVMKKHLVRAAGVVFRLGDDRKESDAICRYATQFSDLKHDYYKKAFKVAAKIGRKIYNCLKSQQPYDSARGLTSVRIGKKKNRSYRLKKRSRELYRQNRVMRTRIAEIYEELSQMGVSSETLQNLQRTVYPSIPEGDA